MLDLKVYRTKRVRDVAVKDKMDYLEIFPFSLYTLELLALLVQSHFFCGDFIFQLFEHVVHDLHLAFHLCVLILEVNTGWCVRNWPNLCTKTAWQTGRQPPQQIHTQNTAGMGHQQKTDNKGQSIIDLKNKSYT